MLSFFDSQIFCVFFTQNIFVIEFIEKEICLLLQMDYTFKIFSIVLITFRA